MKEHLNQILLNWGIDDFYNYEELIELGYFEKPIKSPFEESKPN